MDLGQAHELAPDILLWTVEPAALTRRRASVNWCTFPTWDGFKLAHVRDNSLVTLTKKSNDLTEARITAYDGTSAKNQVTGFNRGGRAVYPLTIIGLKVLRQCVRRGKP
eukprot:6172393-Pleurochrysis_carterae.AAC.1